MRERPILFSAPMVLALLAGRKTQTRRVAGLERFTERGQFNGFVHHGKTREADRLFAVFGDDIPDDPVPVEVPCPFGQPGDTLWVRETTIIAPKRFTDDFGGISPEFIRVDNDGERRLVQYLATSPDREAADSFKLKASPSIFMPRWASRLTLEVTGVRVERLEGLTDADALSEGCQSNEDQPGPRGYRFAPDFPWDSRPRDAFRRGWNELHRGKRSSLWFTDAHGDVRSPWAWVVEFKRVEVTP